MIIPAYRIELYCTLDPSLAGVEEIERVGFDSQGRAVGGIVWGAC